jgi:F-type H+-transporting ATPase subunit b
VSHSIKRTFLQLIVVFLIAGAAEASGEKSDGAVLKETLFQAFNLALLLGVLFYFGRKPISEFFSTRRGTIQSELSQAAELLAQAEKRNSELQRRLVSLGSDVEGIRDESARRAEQEAERILNDARDAAERIRRDARAGVAQELRRAQADLREEAAELALEIAARKLAENVGDADRDRLVDEFILRVEPDASEGRNG